MQNGDCLATAGTRDLPEEQCDQVGLVPGHGKQCLRALFLDILRCLRLRDSQVRASGPAEISSAEKPLGEALLEGAILRAGPAKLDAATEKSAELR